jgi:AAA domain
MTAIISGLQSREQIRELESWQPDDGIWDLHRSNGNKQSEKSNARVSQGGDKLIKTSREFIAGFTPPDYLIDGLLQRQFIYSLTGQTGSGKTAIALLLAYCIATGTAIGQREVQGGRVIYFAGENPDHIRQRWIAMAEHLRFNVEAINVHFVEGVIPLKELEDAIRQEITDTGPATAIIIDTAAAYFLGDDENSNPAMGAYARLLRRLTRMPGGPTVLVNCHPTKNAGADNLLPRGGGAFLAEVDGNLTCSRSDTVVSIHWHGKFRGSEFDTLTFETRNTTADLLKDRKGRPIYTVHAVQLSEQEATSRANQGRKAEDAVLIMMLDAESPPSLAAIAPEAFRPQGQTPQDESLSSSRAAEA